ncbi:hypothetical protein HSBAA_PA_3460 (plasmid) [Vreelandella sulfidaeris]|uniref:OmpA-like domain-containing protein n=1 Tax=Vreelandella sulfidaeris TaxID=115553 RepID=A0A455UK63_9GAMM|nr:hypothetical protein HSBAA_PA_3460 [Halomonas sulfidaeris]
MPDDYKDAMESVLLARFHFEFDSTTLTPTSQREMASFLEGEDLAGRVLIVGYTDHIGPESYNISLSQRRADAIAGQLHLAWPKARFLTEGHGIYPKLVDGTTDEARAANRRAEIFTWRQTNERLYRPRPDSTKRDAKGARSFWPDGAQGW